MTGLDTRTTVVAGSLGDQGGATARALHARGTPVRALSHNLMSPAATRLRELGVDVRHDDLDSPEAVSRDLIGAEHVFGALTPFDKGGRAAEDRQIANLTRAAVQAGASRFVYSAVGDPDQDDPTVPGSLWGVEEMVVAAGLPVTLLRPAFFMENLDEFALRRAADGTLELRMPLDPASMVQLIAVDDVGQLVRIAFDDPSSFGAGPVELAADELTLEAALGLLGEHLGAPVHYVRIPLDEVTNEHAHGMYRWFQRYAAYHADIERLRHVYPGLLRFRDWLAAGRLDLSKLDEQPAA